MPFRSFASKSLLEGGQPLEPPSAAFATLAHVYKRSVAHANDSIGSDFAVLRAGT
jgi:hypothetical protein